MADHPKPPQAQAKDVVDVPDPEEDDLDDLDDMLDDFSAARIDAAPAKLTSGPGRPPTLPSTQPPPTIQPGVSAADAEALDDDDFAKQLQAGMAELMGDLDKSPEMQAQFETIFNQLGAAAAATGTEALSKSAALGPDFDAATPSSQHPVSSGPSAAEPSFQETIRKTMERMQTSGDQATAAASANAAGSEDFLAELLKNAGAAGGDGTGGASEEDFSKMLEGMMEQLTNKEILYEPMKELDDKFPAWLEKNKDTLSKEDGERYATQQGLVREIVSKFEDSKYSDGNAADREFIVAKMQEMQAAGSPPPDLVGDLPPGVDSLGMPDSEACNPQ